MNDNATDFRISPLLPSLLDAPETDPHPAPPGPAQPETVALTFAESPLGVGEQFEIAAVKAALADVDRPIRAPSSLSVSFRHSGWQGDRLRVFRALTATEQNSSRLSNFAGCGNFAHILRSVDDPSIYRIAGSGCHDRFCLPCANERAHSISLNVLEVLQARTVRFLTLTVKSNDEPLGMLLDKLHNSFQKLRRHRLWNKCVTGGVAFLEINWSVQAQRWHPHFHILIEGSYLPYVQVRNLWLAITGDSFVIDIRVVRDGKTAARYVTKYASKPFNRTFIAIPNRLQEAILALKGRKLCLTFGAWRGITLARKPTDGAWEHVGTLERFIERAATGDSHCRAVLDSLSDRSLEPLYAQAPKLVTTGPDPPITDPQATWFGVWKANGTWSHPISLSGTFPSERWSSD